MINGWIDVRIKSVFAGRSQIPGSWWLLLGQANLDDLFDSLESVFPGNHQPQRRSILVRERSAVEANRQNSQRMHCFIKS
jgi:hypothetical protein